MSANGVFQHCVTQSYDNGVSPAMCQSTSDLFTYCQCYVVSNVSTNGVCQGSVTQMYVSVVSPAMCQSTSDLFKNSVDIDLLIKTRSQFDVTRIGTNSHPF